MTRLELGHRVPFVVRLWRWIFGDPLPPAAFCSHCGNIVADQPRAADQARRLYGSRSHSECHGRVNLASPGEPEWRHCIILRTYSQ